MSAPPKVVKQRSSSPYVPLPVSMVHALRSRDFDLFCRQDGAPKPVLYRSAEYSLTEEDISELESRDDRELLVRTADYMRFEQNLAESIDELLVDESIRPAERFTLLQIAVSTEIDVAFRLIRCDRFASAAQRIGGQMVDLVRNEQTLPSDLFGLVQHDYYTFTHVTNVAAFSVMLAERLGFVKEEELKQIAVAGLLHDIGKRFIAPSVLCKPGALDPKERRLIERHPQRGYEDLHGRSDLTQPQLLMVYQHHERVDGTGYPVGILGEEIHPWARLLSVVDVFDAVTSNRPYRRPMKLPDALSLLEAKAGSHFDCEAARCWISAFKQR